MSKSIGKLLGAGSCPININEQVIQNYLAKFNQPTANNLSTPIANNNQPPQPLAYPQMLANGMRAQNESAFAQYDLDKQIAQLHQSLPNNPTLQQQYTQMLANLLSQQINQPAAPVAPSPQPPQPVSQPNPWASVQQINQTTTPQNYELHSNLFNQDMFDIKRNTQSLINLLQGYTYLSPLRINDKYKHAVISCLGAQGGMPSAIATTGLGVVKELYDIAKKIPNSEKYGGYKAILNDSFSDLLADSKGIMQGYRNSGGNCYDMMQNFYSPKIK